MRQRRIGQREHGFKGPQLRRAAALVETADDVETLQAALVEAGRRLDETAEELIDLAKSRLAYQSNKPGAICGV